MALENKFGIKNSAELARKEERIKPKRTGQWFRPCKKIRREPSGDRAGYCSFACYQ